MSSRRLRRAAPVAALVLPGEPPHCRREAQKAEHDRLKKSGQIRPYVFVREVAEGRGGEKKPRRIVSFNKA